MTSVAIYHRSIPNAKSQEKVDFFINFAKGVRAVGDVCIDQQVHTVVPADVGVILGWTHESNQTSMHLRLRKSVIDHQLSKKKYVLLADSNLFLYANMSNPLHYLRYSFNGIFPSTGIYCDDKPVSDRWRKISTNLNLSLKDYRTNGNHILLCLQREGGWSMGKISVLDWAANAILKIREKTDRPIVLRTHPGDKHAAKYIGTLPSTGALKNVSMSNTKTPLQQDLKNCWAVVNHNSSPAVAAAIEGFPVFQTDPSRSQCQEIANTDLSQIENPKLPDRQAWVERIAMSHWNFAETASGECWAHMKSWIQP
jgi:hypothetical protein